MSSLSLKTENLSVSALNKIIRQLLESQLATLSVRGEISNLSYAPSGHVYFSLKDQYAQVRCTLWRTRAKSITFKLQEGQQVQVQCQATLYEPRGDYQLNILAIQALGKGDLYALFLQLKEKLQAEGLLDTKLKRTLPPYPTKIGIITSPSAAALQDVLSTLKRRAPHIQIILYPSVVQGHNAASQLSQMVQQVNSRHSIDQIDALLIIRGGGSIEDLWCFNDETLARQLRTCIVPVISGVGHETDFTLCDFIADVRAATPTAAAELISAHYVQASQRIVHLQQQFKITTRRFLEQKNQYLDLMALRLKHPKQQLEYKKEQLARLHQGLQASISQQISQAHHATVLLSTRFYAYPSPVTQYHNQQKTLAQQLYANYQQYIQRQKLHLESLKNSLSLLSPTHILARGYSIARNRQGKIISHYAQIHVAEDIQLTLHQGEVQLKILDIHPSPNQAAKTHLPKHTDNS